MRRGVTYLRTYIHTYRGGKAARPAGHDWSARLAIHSNTRPGNGGRANVHVCMCVLSSDMSVGGGGVNDERNRPATREEERVTPMTRTGVSYTSGYVPLAGVRRRTF